MDKIQEYVDIKDYSTMRIGGKFKYFAVINDKNDLKELFSFAKEKKVPVFILGGGSNVVFSDGILDILAIKIEIKGFKIVNETDKYTDINVGAGEIWDEIVERTIEMDLSGLESLSAIPGTVGATPVQNVGAYGAEVKDTIIEVEVYDIKKETFNTLSNEDCKFGYRDSIFKSEAKGKYVITAVIFKFKKVDDKKALLEKREEITKTRWSKLPNPKENPNVGSFFKNPIVTKESFLAIGKAYGCTSRTGTSGEIPFFDIGNDLVKVPAGWLIEKAGLKGMSFGNVSIYEKNALVLINSGNATYEDIISARDEIIKIVKDKFGITLEQEPEIL